MRIGYEQIIEQSQKLVMTPDLIQAIRILQYSSQELEEYVQEELLSNPVMELVHDRMSSYQEPLGYRGVSPISDGEDTSDFPMERYAMERGETLAEHLLFQLETADVHSRCKERGRYIIEALDENGYLTMTPEEIAVNLETNLEKVLRTIEVIQGFDPPGVCARDLSECLLIQLEEMLCEISKDVKDEKILEDYRLTEKMIRHHLEALAENRMGHISREMGIPTQRVQEIADIVRKLEPKPGRQFGAGQDQRYIIPDLKVEKVDGKYVVVLMETNTPRLMIGSYYGKLQKESESDEELSRYLNKKLNSAIWLIRSIEQRKQTIFQVASAIVRYQQDFFDEGPKKLKTLTLKQIAEEVGVHESTVSRSINGKYMESPRGVFELKYFFKSGVSRCDASPGEDDNISSMGVKTFIQEMVNQEDPKNPLSDQSMVFTLKEKGIDISRRTVAKYRDEMGIPSSSRRRRY
jgi:RNA polymerase sigma-54 factor